MELTDFNPWWKTNEISEEYKKFKKRDLFDELKKYLPNKQIIVLTGLRRMGKTVIMYQLIDYLLKKNSSENILYFNFDLFKQEIEELLKEYSKITKKDYTKEKIFVLLDEIQKLDNWQNKLKLLYDNYPNIKFIISGSSSLFIENKTKESLAGRSFSFNLLPLNFKEYLQLKDKENLISKTNLFKKDIENELKEYISCGGFPELIDEKDGFKRKKYIKELVIDKIIYIDIPLVFEIEEPELLQRLISIISSSPGMSLDYESLAQDLKRNRKTISNYLFYLEKSFLIKKIYNFSRNLLTSERKKKKFYPSTSSLAELFDAEYGKVVETLVLQNSDFKFFYRKADKEIDFIDVKKKNVIPIEVKSGNNINRVTKKNFINFIKRFNLKQGIFITKNLEKKEKFENIKIKFIPLWKWLIG